MSNNFITRKSLGRTAVLGECYNACKDEFTNDTIFKGKEIKVHTIEENLNKFSVIDDENECVFNRFNLLNVEQELKISVLMEIIKPLKFIDFLIPKFDVLNEKGVSIVCQIYTQRYKLNLEALDESKLFVSGDATHFVNEVDYGITISIELRSKAIDPLQTEKKIKENVDALKKEIESLKKKYMNKIDFDSNFLIADDDPQNTHEQLLNLSEGKEDKQDFSNEPLSRHESFERIDNLDLESDINYNSDHEIFSVPQSDNEYTDDTAIEFYIYSEADNIVIKNNRIDVLKFIEKLISRVIEEDQSYPITYHLRQLRNRNYVPLQNDMSTKIAQIYETIDKNRNFKEGIKLRKYPVKIHEKTHEFPINSEVTWDKTLEDINDKLLNQRNHILKLRNTIICERNNPNPDTISKINGFYEKNEEICHDIHTMLQALFKISIWSQEAPYVGVGDNLDVLVQKDSPFYSSYIFFCSLENRSNQLDENMSLFNNLLNLKQKPCIYVDIDAKCKELFPQHSFKKEIGQNFYDGLIKLGFKGETKICMVERGQITVPDLLDSLRNDSFAQGFNFEKSFEKPDEEVLLSYACPKANSGKCVGRTHYWKCIACEELFKIGYYGYLYCKCGQVSSKELRFKCGDPSHGSKFLLCYNDNFDDYLAIEQPRKELAILVLGGSGVGKSTWINAIANYLRFSSLQEAMESPTICLIHSKFEMTVLENGKLRRRTIEIKPSSNSEFDSDSNETLEDAKSATKNPRIYEFYWKHYKVHIIDTPGMSDTNGLEHDKRNSQKILNAISTYKEIHGICLLFKSNENRLDTSFRYCLSEILLQLHRSALQNMVFFFTYARTSFYRPGDILTTLTTFINDLKETQKLDISLDMYSNVYCIDNESFRFLCAHKSGEEFPKNEIESYSDSWKKSTIETLRFLDNITKIPGHRVDMTISLNQARLIILKMTRPLAQISDLIQTNIKISNDYNKELENCELEINKLATKQKIMTVGYESNKLPYARTVCTSPKCSTIERIPNSDQTTTVYNQICHPHCTLKNIELLQYPQPGLKKCRAMKKTFVSLSGEICQVCGCGWQEHLHIDFEQRKVLFPTEDQTVKKAIANKEDAKTLKQKMIKECNDRIKQYNKEQAKITGKKS